jgi:DNA-binding transcriptional ArsR family regulator
VNPEVLNQYGQVFSALADPTRRAVLYRLMRSGEQSASTLAEGFPVSRQAVIKHLDSLHRAMLVTSRKEGREMLFRARAEQLAATGAAMQAIGASWEASLAELKRLAETASD